MISSALAILETEEQRNELSKIYEHNIKTFYSIAFSKLHNRPDTEDAVQEAFLAVAKKPDVFFGIPDDKKVAYINVIIRNISYKIWNKRHKIAENFIDLDDAVIDENATTEEKVLSDYSCKMVLEFINTLPEGLRVVTYLKMHLGLKNSDIAAVLGISEEAARKRASRAASQIKQYMEDIDNG